MVARKFAAEGSNLAINYVSSKDAAEKLASDLQSQYNVKTTIVQGVWVRYFVNFQHLARTILLTLLSV